MTKESSHPNLPRTLLLLAWALLLSIGLWGSWFLTGSLQFLSGTWGRMGSSISLVALAILAIQQAPNDLKSYARFIAGGMLLGAIGDFFNADLLSFITTQGTIGAIVAFGIGHLLYMAAIIGRLRACTPINLRSTLLAITVWQLVGLLSWFVIVYHGQRARELVWPALGYCLLLAGTTGIASALALRLNKTWLLAFGAALFLISDLLLAIGMFRGSYAFRSEAVWLTYGPGQMLIVSSCWLVSKIQEVNAVAK
ncbi:MAG: lysoplasmalogenase [Pirellulales bacterium]